MSIKEQVRTYIINMLVTEKWQIWSVVPSENQLAIKFNCSRLTIRSVILEFVNRGILISRKGSGYYVSSSIRDQIYFDTFLKSSEHKIHVIPEIRSDIVTFAKLWIQKFLIYKFDDTIHLTRVNRNGKFQEVSYTFINRERIKKVMNEDFNNLHDLFMKNDAKPNFVHREAFYSDNDLIKDDLKRVGWNDGGIIQFEALHDNISWISFSIIISRKEKIKISQSIYYV